MSCILETLRLVCDNVLDWGTLLLSSPWSLERLFADEILEKLLFLAKSDATNSPTAMYRDFSDIYRDKSLRLYVTHLLVLTDRDWVTSTTHGDRFFACWSEIPATADFFVSLSTDSPLSSFGGSLVTENSKLFLLLVEETDSFL